MSLVFLTDWKKSGEWSTMDGKEGKRMNKKKQAGPALLLAAALVLPAASMIKIFIFMVRRRLVTLVMRGAAPPLLSIKTIDF